MRRTLLVRKTPLPRGGWLRRPRRTRPAPAAAWDSTWAPARRLALDRDGHRCRRCSDPTGEVHHRRLRGMGGASRDDTRHRPDRLVSLCPPCHRWVHDHPAAARGVGLIVPRSLPTESVPVIGPAGAFLLTVDGRVSPPAAA